MCAGLILTGCGGEEGDSATDDTGKPSGANNAPTITGSPRIEVASGSAYSFSPSASDEDGDVLTFSVENLPAWASFNAATGRVTGTPTNADLGNYENITIRVSDGARTVALATFAINVVAAGSGAATLSWEPPTTRNDGSALTNLAGYKIYWGTSRGNYTQSVTLDNPGLTSYVVEQLTPATWYFVATAMDSAGGESRFSNVASKTVQ